MDHSPMKLLLQIAVVFGICLVGEGLAALLPIPFPASVISMLLLFLLLLFKVLRPQHIKEKADFLMKHMAFFFIPAGVGIMEQVGLVKDSLLPLILVVVLTTLITFGVTAFTVRGVLALQRRLEKKESEGEETP